MSNNNSDTECPAKADDPSNRPGNSREEPGRDFVRLPIEDWNAMKQQNLEILQMLQSKKWANSSSSSSSSSSESDDNEDRAPKRRKTNLAPNRDDRSRPDHQNANQVQPPPAPQPLPAQALPNPQPPVQRPQANADDNDILEEGEVRDRIDRLLNANAQPQPVNDNINFDNLQREYSLDEDDVSGPVDDNLAQLLDTMSKGNMSEETLTRRFETYKRPRNTSYNVPRVNIDVWSSMDRTTKTRDLKCQRKQKILLTAINSLVKVAQACVSNVELDRRDTMNRVSDAIGLVFKTSKEISMDRRASIVFADGIDKKYRRLLSSDIPVTSWLFGDDLKGALASIEQSSKMSKAFGKFTKKRFNSFSKNGKRFAYGRRDDRDQRRSNKDGKSWYNQKRKFSSKNGKNRNNENQ